MKNIILKGVILAVILVFLFKGGIRMLLVGWRILVPLLVITMLYFLVRALLQNKKPKASLPTKDPIVICPHCQKPRGSCPKCQIPSGNH